jgi:hypothetical protein
MLCLKLTGASCTLEPFTARQMRVAGFTAEGGCVLEPVAGVEPVVASTVAIDHVWSEIAQSEYPFESVKRVRRSAKPPAQYGGRGEMEPG